jgi:DNA primase
LFPLNDENIENHISVASFIIYELERDELELSNPVYNQIIKECKELITNNTIPDIKIFTNHPEAAVSHAAADLLSTSYDISRIWKRKETYIETEEDKLKEIVPSAVLAYKSFLIRQELKETEEKLRKAGNDESLLLQQRYMILKNANMQLAKQLGNRIVF